MAVIFDTNVWIGLLDEDDSLHRQAKSMLNTIKAKIIVPYCVAMEVANILVARVSKEEANQFLFHIINNQDIELVDNDFVKDIVFFGSFDKKMSFTDYSLISLARDKGYELITFDKSMKKFMKSPKMRGKVVRLK